MMAGNIQHFSEFEPENFHDVHDIRTRTQRHPVVVDTADELGLVEQLHGDIDTFTDNQGHKMNQHYSR